MAQVASKPAGHARHRGGSASASKDVLEGGRGPTSAAADPFLAQLAALCRSHPTRAKWVIVSSHAIGYIIGDRLAREGTDWGNLRFATPFDLAVRMAAPFLLERGVDPSEESLGPALLMRLLLDLPEEDGYFRRMAGHPTMAQALWRTVRELRFAGWRAAALRAEAFVSARKHREVQALVAAYERHLERERLADAPAVFEEAIAHATWCPIAAGDLVIELPGAVFPPLVRTFLDALPGTRVLARTVDTPGVQAPERARGLSAPVEPVAPAAARDASRLRFVMTPAGAGPAEGDGSLSVFHAGGSEAEIEEVFRRVLASGEPLDQVEIACASPACAQLAWERAVRLGWEVTLGPGIPAATTRPGRLLLQFCDWLAGDFAAADLRRMLQSGDCAPRAFDAPGDGELTPGQAARVLLKAHATWGRATYVPALTRFAGDRERAAADEDAPEENRRHHRLMAARGRRLCDWVRDVLTSLPEGEETARQVRIDCLADAAAAFLASNASRASATDALALDALCDALRHLKTLGEHRCALDGALGFLREAVSGVVVGRSRPRPGRLHVSLLTDAGFDGRRLVFVVGLQEGKVFPAAVEDPVLLDAERLALDRRLRTSGDRLEEAVFAVLTRLAGIGAASAAVCLSFSCRDTRQYRQTFPSWIVLQAFRLQRGDVSLGYDHLAAALGEPASTVPADASLALTDAGWWLSLCTSNAAARAGVLRAFPSLARGVGAEDARSSEDFTKFDGLVPEAGALLDPSRSDRVTSVTALEAAAACPFRYFLQAGLGVQPIEEERLDDDAWLSPSTRGIELHDLFARIVRHARGKGRAPDLKKDLPRLRAWGEERLDQLRAELPPPSDEVYTRERTEFLDDLDAFLAAECDGWHGSSPVGIEVSFGYPGGGDEEPLARTEPFVLEVGRSRRLRVRGRIDRINRLSPGKYEVIDYKTGGYYGPAWEGAFAGGTRLQHALYGQAATRLIQAHGWSGEVVRSRYVFPAVRGYRRSKRIEAPTPATLTAVLRDLADAIGGGAFALSDERQGCAFCEFAEACHPDDPDGLGKEGTRALRKVRNTGNHVLDAYRRLRSHD